MRFIQKFDNKKGMSPYKYDNGKIYMIESAIGECCYIGSTINSLEHRFKQHCNNYRKGRYRTSAEVLQYPDAEIILILKYPCKNKYELCRKEGEFIKNHNNCVNKYIAGRTKKEYRDSHKKEASIQHKLYHEKNKEKLNMNTKLYRQKNKILLRQKANQKIKCECGLTSNRSQLARHRRTKIHLKLLNQFQQDA